MSRKRKDFILTSHCLLNPHCRVHILGKNFVLPSHIYQYLLSHNIGVIQLPCPEFTAMGYWRNPQGRQQYNNVFFRKHCEDVFHESWLMTQELLENNHRLIGYIGIQGSPTCSIYWGKHKTNKYHTESMNPIPDDKPRKPPYVHGVFTDVIKENLLDKGIKIPFIEAPVKESLHSPATKQFWSELKQAVEIPY